MTADLILCHHCNSVCLAQERLGAMCKLCMDGRIKICRHCLKCRGWFKCRVCCKRRVPTEASRCADCLQAMESTCHESGWNPKIDGQDERIGRYREMVAGNRELFGETG